MHLYLHKDWPAFRWDHRRIAAKLSAVRYKQGYLLGRMDGIGSDLQAEAFLRTLTDEVIKSCEIDGQSLDPSQVRSSISRRLRMDIAGLVPSDRNVDSVVEMMLDATQNYDQPLTEHRLFGWQKALFPFGCWRTIDDPASEAIEEMMCQLTTWFNDDIAIDPVLKAAIAHFWFVTIHPFDEGNGIIARAITEMQLARTDNNCQRFYSMSAQIQKERKAYYEILEATQKGDLDITGWLVWFLDCLERALDTTHNTLQGILKKASFWDEHAATSLNDRQIKILNLLFDGFEGKLTSSKWAKLCQCSQDTANRDINDLIDRGILIKAPEGGRSTNYLIKE